MFPNTGPNVNSMSASRSEDVPLPNPKELDAKPKNGMRWAETLVNPDSRTTPTPIPIAKTVDSNRSKDPPEPSADKRR